MKNFTKLKIFRFFLYIFAIIGFIFFIVFLAMQFSLLNVRGSSSERNSYFNIQKNINKNDNSGSLKIICQINNLSKYAPSTSINIYKTLIQGGDTVLLNRMLYIASQRFLNNNNFIKNLNNCENVTQAEINLPISSYVWADTDEWNLMKEVFTRDQDIINKAAHDANVSPRIILSGVIGEQFRFFTSRRESFKGYFEPLKILASLSKVSFGIAGIKPKTVRLIEEHLKDINSPFYLGKNMENIVDHPDDANLEADRLNRITDVQNPYYSYLYVGLYMKQIEAQWARSGYDISKSPGILSTLYNLGFYYSVPKYNPQIGGAEININDVIYTFGDLGYEFYYSGELVDIFPLVSN
ncbi:MAG: hypothetical protein WCX46_00595 [Candidatus Paceibacterota bacterium]